MVRLALSEYVHDDCAVEMDLLPTFSAEIPVFTFLPLELS